MSQTKAPPGLDSLTDHVVPLLAGAQVVSAGFCGSVPMLVMADGDVRIGGHHGAAIVKAHADGAVLCAMQAGDAFITGGDDGKVMRIAADGALSEIADENGKWVDAVACGPDGSVAWSAGKNVRARDRKGVVKTFAAPSSVRGLVFAPKGYRLGIAHRDGASLWFPNTDAKPDILEWKGSHLDIMWSPNGRFVVTSMQENQLHGWGLPEKQHMRMSGYPSKTRSMSWSHDGLWLATSGADAAIIWPFQGEKGPMGKPPRECGVRPAKVSQVAFHPKSLVLAIGYEDGCILLCRLTDASELLVRRADKDSGRVSALAWDKAGRRLIFGTAEGAAGLLTLPV
ncbi:MAG: WD40 repeat domain-containing protein [Beijerinckiaceae bacterium]